MRKVKCALHDRCECDGSRMLGEHICTFCNILGPFKEARTRVFRILTLCCEHDSTHRPRGVPE